MDKEKSSDIDQENTTFEEKAVSSNVERWFSRYSKSISALTAIGTLVTTAVLATVTYQSLKEVKQQRELTFKQFVVAHAPSVRIGTGPGFNCDDDGCIMTWMVANEGGPVNDIELKSVLMCCGLDILQKKELNKYIVRTSNKQRLHRNEQLKIMLEVRNSDSLNWLRSVLDKKEYGLYLYTRAKYTIPAELSIDGKEKQDSAFQISGWDPFSKSFEYVGPKARSIILKLIEGHGCLSEERRG